MTSEVSKSDRECGTLFVVSAPSGTGKTTLVKKVMEQMPGLRFSISHTTRAPRAGEKDGRDYHFVSTEVFRSMIEKGDFLEWAEILGNFYGTARRSLETDRAGRCDWVLDVDVQGARQVREKVKDAVLIFLLPPSPEALQERLANRGLDRPDVVQRRLAHALQEIGEAHRYDYVVLNERIENAVRELQAIILATRCQRQGRAMLARKIKEWEEHHGKNYR